MTMPESSHITDTEDQIVLSPGAVPPFCKFDWLRDHNATFALTWRAERPDLESDSDYDLSLASMALNAQWSNQEVVDLLLAWRKRHGRDHNLPQSYYVTVLARAKLLVEQTEAQDRMEEAIHMPVPDPSSRELLQSLSVIFNVSIGRFVKYDGDPPTYSVFTEKGHATIGRIDDITSQTKFRNAFAAATDILIPKCNQATWEQRAQAILQACETVNMGDSSYSSEETLTWLHDYLAQETPCESIEEAITTKKPFIHNNGTYIFLVNFRRWVAFNRDNRLSSHAIGQRLTNCGAMAEPIPITVGHKRTTRSCWRVPERLL